MSDYISREAAIAEIMGQPPDAHYPDWYASIIEKLPAADVRPVVHGKWIEKEVEVCRVRFYTGEDENGETHTIRAVEKGKEKEQRCPHCGAQADVFWQNYCPRCGAEMKES